MAFVAKDSCPIARARDPLVATRESRAGPEPAGSNVAGFSEIAGAPEEGLVEMARLVLPGAVCFTVKGVSHPADPDRDLYESGALLPGPAATLAGPTFEEWLRVGVLSRRTTPTSRVSVCRQCAQLSSTSPAVQQVSCAVDGTSPSRSG